MPPFAAPVHSKHRLEQVWRQHASPVFYRRGKGHPLLMRLPVAVDTRAWLQARPPPKTVLGSTSPRLLGAASQLVQ